jgi:hypothetical protein
MKRLLFEDMDMYYNKYNANIAARDLKPPTHTLQDLLNYFTSQYPNVTRAPKQSPAPLINSDTKTLEMYNLVLDLKSNIQASMGNPVIRKNPKLLARAGNAVKLLNSVLKRIKLVDKLLVFYKI